jgi:hypothetical protein
VGFDSVNANFAPCDPAHDQDRDLLLRHRPPLLAGNATLPLGLVICQLDLVMGRIHELSMASEVSTAVTDPAVLTCRR